MTLLARNTAGAARVVAQMSGARSFSSSPVPQATLRDLEGRIKSVRNISKITKSMKMIATTRLNKAQAAMRTAKKYGAANGEVYKEAEAGKDSEDLKILWIVTSSDRGLCGGIHSSVSKFARKEIGTGDDKIVILGDKPKAQLSRSLPNNIVLSVNQLGKATPTFTEACAIAEKIEEVGVEFDKVNLIYNKFVSVISYEASILEIFNAESLKTAPNFAAYELEDEGLVKDLTSFALANAVYTALAEGYAAEVSARRNAMDNASKNANEMIDKLQMSFNRIRQATITNELVDIITGASAL